MSAPSSSQTHNTPPSRPRTPTASPISTILSPSLPLPHLSPTAAPFGLVDGLIALLATLLITVAVAVPEVAVLVVVGVGNESDEDEDEDARLQNCWASCSVMFSNVGQLVDIQETTPWVNLRLTQKQLTSTTLVQLASEIAVSKHVTAQGGIPVRLGNCAVLVEVGMVELDCTLPLGGEVALMLFVDDPDVNELGGVRGGL